jgi:hypothetical protein
MREPMARSKDQARANAAAREREPSDALQDRRGLRGATSIMAGRRAAVLEREAQEAARTGQLGLVGEARVHTDDHAAARASAVGARAYTRGEDIFFARGAYQPGTSAGRRLLAHELAHVAQFRSGRVPPGIILRQADAGVEAGPSDAGIVDAGPPYVPTVSEYTVIDYAAVPEGSYSIPVGLPEECSPETLAYAQIGAEDRRRAAFTEVVLTRAPLVDTSIDEQLDKIAQLAPTYALIRSRREKQRSLDIHPNHQWLQYYRNTDKMYAEGNLEGGVSAGVPATPETYQHLESELAALRSDIDLLDSLIAADLGRLGVDESTILHLCEHVWPQIWITRAKQIAFTQLTVSREQVRAVAATYPWGISTAAGEELRDADDHLAGIVLANGEYIMNVFPEKYARRNELLQLRRQLMPYIEFAHMRPAGSDRMEDLEIIDKEIAAIDADINAVHRRGRANKLKYNDERNRLAATMPILLFPNYYPGVFRDRNDEEIHNLTGSWTNQILSDIDDTKENIADGTIKVWHLHHVPDLTFNDLAIPKESALGAALTDYTTGLDSQESFLEKARLALEIGVTLIVGIIFPPAGVALGLLFAGIHVVEDVQQIMVETAAEHTHYDPLFADISLGEPNYLALALDVVGLGLSLPAAASLLRGAGRALKYADAAAEFAAQVRRALPVDEAEVVIKKTMRRRAVHGLSTEGAEPLRPARALDDTLRPTTSVDDTASRAANVDEAQRALPSKLDDVAPEAARVDDAAPLAQARPGATAKAPDAPKIDPGGRGKYHLDERFTSRLSTEDANQLRALQSNVPDAEEQLEKLVRLRRKAVGTDLPQVPGTPEHMLDRWRQYLGSNRPKKMPFKQWAAGHPSRMRSSVKGIEVEDAYRTLLGGDEQAPSKVLTSPGGKRRQVDSVTAGGEGEGRTLFQAKSGRESLTTTARASGGRSRGASSLSNNDALDIDRTFVEVNKDKVVWAFEDYATGPLIKKALNSKVIAIHRVSNAAGKDELIMRIVKHGKMSRDAVDKAILDGRLIIIEGDLQTFRESVADYLLKVNVQ